MCGLCALFAEMERQMTCNRCSQPATHLHNWRALNPRIVIKVCDACDRIMRSQMAKPDQGNAK